MDILQLYSRGQSQSNFAHIMEHFTMYNIINKHKIDRISLVSYDAFIITIDFLNNNYADNIAFFEELDKLKKPIVFIYDANNRANDLGMDFLAKKYKIEFDNYDCSVLETNGWNYKPSVLRNCGIALGMNSKHCIGFCSVKNTENFYMLKKDNITIVHDIYYNFMSEPNLFGYYDMLNFIFDSKNVEEVEKVDWLNNVTILDDKLIYNNLTNNSNKIDELLNEKKLLEQKLKNNEFYKAILYSSGDNLVEVTKKILEEMLDVTIDDYDLKKQDLHFSVDGVDVLVEVKGVNHPFKRENISQVKRHIKDFAEKNNIYGADVEKICKGVLILNPYSLHDLKDKIAKEFYSKEVIADAEYDKICTLDTLTLLNYYSKWKSDPKIVDLKNIILKTNYNKPNYADIINL